MHVMANISSLRIFCIFCLSHCCRLLSCRLIFSLCYYKWEIVTNQNCGKITEQRNLKQTLMLQGRNKIGRFLADKFRSLPTCRKSPPSWLSYMWHGGRRLGLCWNQDMVYITRLQYYAWRHSNLSFFHWLLTCSTSDWCYCLEWRNLNK